MSSLSFNGTSDFARATPTVTSFPYTMCSWFYCTSFAAARGIVHLNNSSSTLQRAGLQVFTSGVLRMAAADTANTSSDTVNTVTASTWQLATGVFTSATSRKVILNGDIANAGSSATSRTPTGLNRFSIGVNDASTQTIFFIGQIWATGLWSAALTDEEIVAMWKGFPMGSIRPQSLKQFFPYPGLSGRDWLGANSLAATGATANANTPSIPHPVGH